jgi:hypothetical protein
MLFHIARRRGQRVPGSPWRSAGTALIALILLPPIAAQLPTPAITVVAGGHLVDGTGAPVRRGVDIFIADGAITALEPTGTRPTPDGALVVDAVGKWVVPGLIDSHVHYRPWMAELLLHHGVTSVFDLGNRMDILEQRNALGSGRVAGPRLFVAGQGLEGPVPGMSAEKQQNPLRRRVESAADAAARATFLLDQGVDAIKVREWMPADWIRAVTAVAHARNKPVLGHLNTPVHEALDAGLDALIHPYGVDQSTLTDRSKLEAIQASRLPLWARTASYPFHLLEPDRYAPLIQKMVRKTVYFNPTFGNQFRGVYAEGGGFDRDDAIFFNLRVEELGDLAAPLEAAFVPYFGRSRSSDAAPAERARAERGMENVAEFMRQFSRAGGKMVAGTDSSGPPGMPGARLHRELQLWVARGIPPMEALRAATQYPAQLLRLEDRGTIERGKRGDLLVLRGNPLEDIRLLGSIDVVLLDGRVVSRALSGMSLKAALQDR